MNNETSPVDQEAKGETLEARMKFFDVPQVGPFVLGRYIPLHGLEMRIVKLEANKNMDFVVVLAPQAVTKGHLKRATGKKGKRAAKAARKARS